MITDPYFYILAICSVLIVGISKSGFGAGLSVLGVPLMALVIPPAQAAAILLPLLCLIDLFNLVHYRAQYDRVNFWILLPAALAGIVVGAFSFRYLSEAHIRIMLGVISILFVLNYFFRGKTKHRQTAPDRLKGSLWGSVAGFTSFGVHAGALPASIYLLPQRLDKTIYVGTTVILFAVLNYVKLIPYALLGQLNGNNLLTSLVLAPLVPVGFWLGIQLHRRLNERVFYILAYLFLLLAGLKLLYEGLLSL